MSSTAHQVVALFAEPLFKANIAAAISPQQIDFIKNLKMMDNIENLISENKYIFEEPQLKSIKDAIQEVLDIYAEQVMGVPQRLYVTQSWSLINKSRAGMHGHAHSNSIISGSLYYCEMPEPAAAMTFVRQITYQQIDLRPPTDKRNVYNTPVTSVTPARNEVFLFPSCLTHTVDPNGSTEPRYAIAFNTFVKGKLGDYHTVSELNL
jgi:uncharacterized protein (TIGR02466 family)